MKKSLIALAALAFVGTASAQSSVTLYGMADIWAGKAQGTKFQLGTDGLASSRVGVKGIEDLGGGLKAKFNFEQYLNLTNGATNGATNAKTWDREANVGLSSDFGEIKLGKSFSPYYDVRGITFTGFYSVLSANDPVWLGYTGTVDAQIYYATPEIAGLSGAVSSVLPGNKSGDGFTSMHLKYANGPLFASLSYEADKQVLTAITKHTQLNGSYDMGMIKLLGSYNTVKLGSTAKANEYQFGADVPLSGALTLSTGYASSKTKTGSLTTRKSTGYGVALSYNLSKRTVVYSGYRSNKTDGIKGSLYAAGVNHSF